MLCFCEKWGLNFLSPKVPEKFLLQSLSGSDSNSNGHTDHGVVTCAEEAKEASQAGFLKVKKSDFCHKMIVIHIISSTDPPLYVDKCGRKIFVHMTLLYQILAVIQANLRAVMCSKIF